MNFNNFCLYRWHGWMHHMFDETPQESNLLSNVGKTAVTSDAVYSTHLGGVLAESFEQVDVSQYR